MSSESILQTSGMVTTILGVLNQFQAFTDLPYKAVANSTINYKRGVLAHITQPEYQPKLKYFGIGIKGFKNQDMEQSSLAYPSDARCMDMYDPLPFRVILLTEEQELMKTQEGRAQLAPYRMRTVETHDGIQYACYWLKMITFNDSVNVVKRDAQGKETPFVFDDSWLYPVPPDFNQIGGALVTDLNRVIVRATGNCKVTNEEVMEAVNAIHHGESKYARISEFGYYTGYDVGLNASGTIATKEEQIVRYEAAYVQLAKHHCFCGSDLYTPGSYIAPTINLESQCCINGSAS